MKPLPHLIITIVIVQLMTLAFSASPSLGQDKANLANSQYQAEHFEKYAPALTDETLQDDKNLRVRVLELMIKYNLNNRYQRIENEELEDMLDKRR